MDEVPATVFQPEDGDGEFAIVIDRGDAPFLRDLLARAAEDRFKRATKAKGGTIRTRNGMLWEIFRKYADRCEQVRVGEAERIAAKIRASQG